ncbi:MULTISPECIES: hypothetical protein [Nocardia]|uniref:hypothetical protein n=1 Tax=Nocardia TaxID=1817 RepID=UPI000B021A5A|nr:MULTISPECIES: hypothetical protein [Nocardia]
MTLDISSEPQFAPLEIGSHTLYIPGRVTASAHDTSHAEQVSVRSDSPTHHNAPAETKPVRSVPRAWPVLLLALPAFVAIWSGWVGLGQLTGFGPVRPLPGIWDQFTLNTAITLPIGMEAYASYALYVWLSGRIRSDRTRSYAKYSAFGSLVLGAVGQVAYHLMRAAGVAVAPWPVTVLVACLPVGVLGMGAALAHMIIREHHAPNLRTDAARAVRSPESVGRSACAERVTPASDERHENGGMPVALPTAHQIRQIEATPAAANAPAGARDRWADIAEEICSADPAGRRDPEKVATILRLRFERKWPHARIADHVELSRTAVTRTINAARDHLPEGAAEYGK